MTGKLLLLGSPIIVQCLSQIGPLVREKIKEINRETRSVVKVNEEISRKFWTKNGVRQGCQLNPTLFALYITDLHRRVYEERAIRRSTNRKLKNVDVYVDDIVLIAKTETELQEILKRLKNHLKKRTSY